ncbi:triose-phosphate isomerase [Chitinibacter sp. SCUT-21]|uniref:triose-phosphate isomerase n=1 Tax=Chitinibacter sp. SCUT-21 TaxID=2970891 RepID=UPI0035A6396F
MNAAISPQNQHLFQAQSHLALAARAAAKADGPQRRQKMVVANWKMHGSFELCHTMIPAMVAMKQAAVDLVVCPPAPFLAVVSALANDSGVACSAQDVAELASGARTGEWSAAMLLEVGCRYALVGHSERRQHHYEDDALIAGKARACLNANIIPIVCIGESASERERGETEQVLCNQLDWLMTTPGWRNAIIAYEPRWAIGTNQAATPEVAQETHALIRRYLAQTDASAAASMSVLYGGSVKASNAQQLLEMDDIDGVLVGAAALELALFAPIYDSAVNCANKLDLNLANTQKVA